MKKNDIIGKKFGRLTVIDSLNEHPGCGNHIILRCKCDCGKETTVRKTNLLKGKKLSCGCLTIERTIQRNTKHGCFGTRIYRIWNGIMERTKYKSKGCSDRYWKRGISVCKEWENFENFKDWAIKNGYRDNLSIDRIDNNGNYEPSNCRWATKKEQSRNTSKNILIEYDGKKICISELAEILHIPYGTIWKRINNGYTTNEVVYKGKYSTRYKR